MEVPSISVYERGCKQKNANAMRLPNLAANLLRLIVFRAKPQRTQRKIAKK
jgi:hypothetical protein